MAIRKKKYIAAEVYNAITGGARCGKHCVLRLDRRIDILPYMGFDKRFHPAFEDPSFICRLFLLDNRAKRMRKLSHLLFPTDDTFSTAQSDPSTMQPPTHPPAE
jgi:hypothetical protein